MATPRVDCHSHVFNAEDLPIEGFIGELSSFPSILTKIVSVPLDRLTQWVANSSHGEADYLASLLVPHEVLAAADTAAAAPPPVRGSDLVSDEELDELFLQEWQRRGLVGDTTIEAAFDAALDPETVLAEGAATPEAAKAGAELDAWLVSQGDAELAETMAMDLLPDWDWIKRMKAAREAVGRYVDALRLITRDRHLVAASLADTYQSVSLFVPALVDFEYTASDKPSSPVADQIRVHSLLSKVSVVGKVPGASWLRIHPMVGYCPYREVDRSELRQWRPSQGGANGYVPYADPAQATAEDRYRDGIEYVPERARPLRVPSGSWETGHVSLDEAARSLDIVRHAVELGGFVGVKLYPPAGYLPLGNSQEFDSDQGSRLDAALQALYAYCVRMDVPILAHAGHSNGFEDRYNDFAGPAGWRAVLQKYPDLRICFGHFGHLYKIGDDPSKPASSSWASGFVALMDEHPHVYVDVGNSKFPVEESYRTKYLELLGWVLGGNNPSEAQRKRRRRVMFGTDYWMNTLAPNHRNFLSVFDDKYRQAFGAEAGDDFLGRNALRWLGIVDEEGDPDPTNANRQRLRDFYDTRPLPSWLG
jgi:predicted TIM-barrel fold metal-dependent hydrolase